MSKLSKMSKKSRKSLTSIYGILLIYDTASRPVAERGEGPHVERSC